MAKPNVSKYLKMLKLLYAPEIAGEKSNLARALSNIRRSYAVSTENLGDWYTGERESNEMDAMRRGVWSSGGLTADYSKVQAEKLKRQALLESERSQSATLARQDFSGYMRALRARMRGEGQQWQMQQQMMGGGGGGGGYSRGGGGRYPYSPTAPPAPPVSNAPLPRSLMSEGLAKRGVYYAPKKPKPRYKVRPGGGVYGGM